MSTALTHKQLEALAAMVDLGQQDRMEYLSTYAGENEETAEQIAAGRRQVELASEALAVIRGNQNAPSETGEVPRQVNVESDPVSLNDAPAPGTEEDEEEGPGHLITISADFRVTGDADSIRGSLERTVVDLLEDGSNDGIYSIPGNSVDFLSAEVTALYPEEK